MTSPNPLFSPFRAGALHLAHRIVLAPLTRMRTTQPGDIPNSLMARYYRQRATLGGLLITEATQVTPYGKGYPATPGIHSPEQVEGWKLVTRAAHEAGAVIALQLWHVGRISHTSLQPNGHLPVAPSAVPAAGKAFTADWQQVPFQTPRALDTAEIPTVIDAYRQGALNAKAAGFDAVEIHSANGYLPDQFLHTGTNRRTDRYGGSIENRARFLLEVTDAVTSVWGPERVGVRLSPYGTFNDMHDDDPLPLFTYVVSQLSHRNLAYLHLVEPRASMASAGKDANDNAMPDASTLFRKLFQGALISAGGYDPTLARSAVAQHKVDAVAFGRHFIANPDLVERIRQNAPLNPYHRPTFYGGGEKGYIDYPLLSEATVAT